MGATFFSNSGLLMHREEHLYSEFRFTNFAFSVFVGVCWCCTDKHLQKRASICTNCNGIFHSLKHKPKACCQASCHGTLHTWQRTYATVWQRLRLFKNRPGVACCVSAVYYYYTLSQRFLKVRRSGKNLIWMIMSPCQSQFAIFSSPMNWLSHAVWDPNN